MEECQPIDTETLIECLDPYPLELAVLFGSRATGETNRLSDLDLAVAFHADVPDPKRPEYLDEMVAELTRQTGIEAIDLVDLDRASPAMRYDILSKGELLIGEESALTERETEALLRKLDFQPVKSAWQDALRCRIEEGEYGRPG
ncbi:MAG: nucleotidyltransferase domain-containing protein [Halobacteriales archaeon]